MTYPKSVDIYTTVRDPQNTHLTSEDAEKMERVRRVREASLDYIENVLGLNPDEAKGKRELNLLIKKALANPNADNVDVADAITKGVGWLCSDKKLFTENDEQGAIDHQEWIDNTTLFEAFIAERYPDLSKRTQNLIKPVLIDFEVWKVGKSVNWDELEENVDAVTLGADEPATKKKTAAKKKK